MTGKNFVTLVADYDALRDHGLRIVRDESYSITHDPKHIELGDVNNLLVGLNIALNSVPVTRETVAIRDFILEMLDTKFKPALNKLNQEEYDMEDEENDW